MITVYSIPNCRNCELTKKFLSSNDIEFKSVDITKDEKSLQEVLALGYKNAPVVITDDEHWGGFNLLKLNNYKKSLEASTPKKKLLIVLASSNTNNSRDFVSKLDYDHVLDISKDYVKPEESYLLITGTYADHEGNNTYHENVEKLLQDEDAVSKMVGVVASGNAVFGTKFAWTGKEIAKNYNKPFLLGFELKGTDSDVEKVKAYLKEYNHD